MSKFEEERGGTYSVKASSSSLKTRIATGMVVSAIVAPVLLVHNYEPLVVVTAILFVLSVAELANLIREIPVVILGALTGGAFLVTLSAPPAAVPWWSAGFSGIGATMLAIRSFRNWPGVPSLGVAGWLSGGLTSTLFLKMFSLQANEGSWLGMNLAFACIFSVSIGDICAYAFGKRFGKHKLAPRISPSKTWEGSAAHVAGAVLAFVATTRLIGAPLDLAIICGVVGSVAGQLGDLLQSSMKRGASLKDSGELLPGHGGLLDRIDALLLALPAQTLFLWIYAPQLFHVKH